MIKKMLVNATHPEENRVAIVDDGILTELDIEIEGREQTKGNIYKAVVVRVETGLQAAFVDYGAERLGFLQLGEIHSKYYPQREGQEAKSRPRINEIFQRGQEILVQIVKEERGNKGAALTTFLSLPGRYMVVMPDDTTRGISRKIPDGKERKELRQAVDNLELPENTGHIIRTAAIGQTQTELQRDLDYLVRLFKNITELSNKIKAPALVYQESNLVLRFLRDYFTLDMDEILIDDPNVFQQAKEFIEQVMPEHAKLLKLHQERRPVFSKYQIEEQIETIGRNQIVLPSGGSIVIDSTEALVAIDVNSGKMASEQGVEATAFKTNLEAAVEVARQLRLRDLGGLVVIDFIDMRDRKHIREVEKKLQHALKSDKARVTVGRISQFGLLEMSRQRIKAALAAGSFKACPHCDGSGKIKSTEAQAVAVLRKIHAGIAKGNIERVIRDIPLDVAEYLLNTRREELHEMERRHRVNIYLRGKSDLLANQDELIFQRKEKEEKRSEEPLSQPVTASEAMAESQKEPHPRETTDENESQSGSEQKPHSQSKSRRSRGRRRKSNGESGQNNQNQSSLQTTEGTQGPETSSPKSEAAESGDQSGTDVAPATEPAASGEQESPKRPSRRRTRKRKGPDTTEKAVQTETSSESGATDTEKPNSETAASNTTAEGLPSETPVVEKDDKPKRPTRRRTRKKPETESAETAAETKADPVASDQTGNEATPADQPAADVAEKPKRPTRRRTRKKPETESAEPAAETKTDPATSDPKVNEITSAEQPAADMAEKPKRSNRRPARKKAAQDTPTGSDESVPVEAPSPPAEAGTETKPKRRAAAPRKRSTKAQTETTPPEGQEPIQKKPIRKRKATGKPPEEPSPAE